MHLTQAPRLTEPIWRAQLSKMLSSAGKMSSACEPPPSIPIAAGPAVCHAYVANDFAICGEGVKRM